MEFYYCPVCKIGTNHTDKAECFICLNRDKLRAKILSKDQNEIIKYLYDEIETLKIKLSKCKKY